MHLDSAVRKPGVLCELAGIEKRFGGVQALNNVTVGLRAGEVHALVGENGAGKSTLAKILVGAEQPDAGSILIDGSPVSLRTPREAAAHGIAIVFQELNLFPDLDVLSNVCFGREPMRVGFPERAAMRRACTPLAARLHISSLDAKVGELPLGEQQLVAIAKALYPGPRIVVFDEPNSALNGVESERLFGIIRNLRERGVCAVYVSHRLEEVFALADRITVLRDGRVALESSVGETSIPAVVSAMLGRSIRRVQARATGLDAGETALRVEHLSTRGALRDISFEARAGEIVGLAGLEGAGIHELFDVLSGLRSAKGGAVVMPDGRGTPRSVSRAASRGIARVPADRRTQGLALLQSVADNLAHVTAGSLRAFGVYLRPVKLREAAARDIAGMGIIGASPGRQVGLLSGGNQQKVLLGKWLATQPRLLLCDDPTRGIDVGAKAEIYRLLTARAKERVTVLLASSELPEYVALCDRVLIVYQGRIRGELSGERLNEHAILEAINTGRT
jgi:ABC-type sugar transport system ATPase subunit